MSEFKILRELEASAFGRRNVGMETRIRAFVNSLPFDRPVLVSLEALDGVNPPSFRTALSKVSARMGVSVQTRGIGNSGALPSEAKFLKTRLP